jgi:predicted NUDIX family NTP pyrophosphohydrolase
MAKRSAGVLVYRRQGRAIDVLLVHPGGPFWKKRDAGAWSIPKGEFGEDELREAVARREFTEETGWTLDGELTPLGEVKQAGGKTVVGFCSEADFDVGTLASNTFEIEWPPRSGRRETFAEVDRAGWFGLEEAGEKINEGQRPFLERLAAVVDQRGV